MKKIVAALLFISLLGVASPAFADEVERRIEKTCTTKQYGAQECTEKTTEVKIERPSPVPTVPAGTSTQEIASILAITGLSGVIFGVLYRKTYKSYIFDR